MSRLIATMALRYCIIKACAVAETPELPLMFFVYDSVPVSLFVELPVVDDESVASDAPVDVA